MTNISSAFYNYDETVEKSKTSYSGLLGLAINGNRIVNHPTRAGYVYVRLRDNLSEVVQAFNDKVSPVYDFPVLIQRKGNRWYVLGRDDLRYETWGTSAPYLPRHGDQHSFNRDGGGGGDVVWTYPDQFMPLLVYPSGTYGGSNLLIAPYVLQKSDKFIYVGNTGTSNIARYKPTTSSAIMGLVYLDRDTGNPGFLINSGTPFSGSITGTNAIVPYLPYPSSNQEPLYAFRLVSGTTSITWDNLYNVRQFIGGSTSTGTSGGVSDHESLTGLLGGSANNHYHLTPSQIVGLVSGTSTTLHSHASGGGTGISAATQIDQAGGTSDTYGALAGLVNGSNQLYTVSQGVYVSGMLEVYLNGQLQTQGSGQDWVETTPASGTFAFAVAPPTGSEITAIYTYSVAGVAAGVDTQVQFNDGGVLAGDAGFTFNKTSNIVYIATSGTGYVDLLDISNSGDPGNGATGFKVGNTASSIAVRTYGSGAPGVLANAAGIFALSGSAFIIGGATGTSTYLYSNNRYTAPEISINYLTGFVGINTTAPISLFNTRFPDAGVSTDIRTRGILTEYYGGTAAFAKGAVTMLANGTKASPAAVAANNTVWLGVPLFYDGTIYRAGATLGSYVTAVTNNTSVTSELRFLTGAVTGAAVSGSVTGLSERMRIDPTGLITVGTAGGGTARLSVVGSTNIIQNRVLGNSTQTALLASWETSSGTVTNSMSLVSGTVFNEQGSPSLDFRIESDTETDMMFLDSSADAVYFGGSTNAVKITKGGELSLIGTATVWDDLRISPDVKGTGSKDPTWSAWLSGLYLYDFDNASAGSEKELWFNVQMPHGWKEGTSVYPHVHWVNDTAGTAGQVVRWGLEYTVAKIGATFPAVTTVYATTIVGGGDITVADEHMITSFDPITMTGNTISTILVCRLFRNSSDAADTYGGTAGLLSIDWHFEIDKIGSSTEFA